MSKHQMNNDNQNIDDYLKEQTDKTPFELPEGYFDTFSDRLNSRMEEGEGEIPTKKSILRILKPILLLAAAMLLLVFIVNKGLNFLDINKPLEIALTTEQNEILELDWLDIGDDLFLNETLATFELTDDDLIEYLVDDDIDLSEIVDLF